MRIADPVGSDRHPLPNRSHARSHVGDAIHFQLALKADSHAAKWPTSIASHWIAAEAPYALADQDGGHSLPGKCRHLRPIDNDMARIYGEPPASDGRL